jgi:hypothetical protein
MSNMIRQIMALFDEYQSKENAKHTLRAMKENARQGGMSWFEHDSVLATQWDYRTSLRPNSLLYRG